MQDQLMRAPYHLRPFQKHPYQLDISQMVVCAPGAKSQSIHQDCGKHIFDFRGMLEPSASTMWALRDYTATNGATRCIPGSHLWRSTRHATYAETVPAIMPAGSCFLFSSALWHCGGPNNSDATRWAVNMVRHLAPIIVRLFNHVFSLFLVVSRHMRFLPYKYRLISEMESKLMRLCFMPGRRTTRWRGSGRKRTSTRLAMHNYDLLLLAAVDANRLACAFVWSCV